MIFAILVCSMEKCLGNPIGRGLATATGAPHTAVKSGAAILVEYARAAQRRALEVQGFANTAWAFAEAR